MTSVVLNPNLSHIKDTNTKDLNCIAEMLQAQANSSGTKANESNSRLDAANNKLDAAAQHAMQTVGEALANKPKVANNFLALVSQPNPHLADPHVQAALVRAMDSTNDQNEKIKTITQLTNPELYAANANNSSNSDPVIPPAYTDNSGSVNSDSIKALLANKGLNVLIIAMYVMLLLGDTDDSIIRQDSETFNENTDAVNNINGAMDVYTDISKALQDWSSANPNGKSGETLADLYNHAFATNPNGSYKNTDNLASQLRSDLGPTVGPLNINDPHNTSINAGNITQKDLDPLISKYTANINAAILSISPGLTLIGNLTADDISSADKIGSVTTSINNITSTLKSAQTSGQSVSNKQSTQVQTDTTTYNNHISAAQGMLSVLKQLIQEIWR